MTFNKPFIVYMAIPWKNGWIFLIKEDLLYKQRTDLDDLDVSIHDEINEFQACWVRGYNYSKPRCYNWKLLQTA